MKRGYYVDEGMTLFLANGNYNGAVTSKSEFGIGDFISKYIARSGDTPIDMAKNIYGMLSELVNAGNYSKSGTIEWYDDARSMLQGTATWVTGAELLDDVIATKGSRFQYAQIYINQALDVHPCLYYFAVNTVFSLFPGVYSDYFLFAVNIIFLILTCIVMYLLMKRYFNEYVALLSVIIFGFSQGFASCAMYFRMYAMLTFWIVLSLYMHLDILGKIRDGISGKKTWILLGLVVLLGFNTHYYYILFLIPLFVLSCIYLHSNKKMLKSYIKCMVLTGVLSLIIWPFSLYHILFGYRGTEAVSNLTSGGFVGRLYEYVGEFATAFLCGKTWIFLIVVAVAILVLSIRLYKHEINVCFWLCAFVPSLFYFLIIVQVAPTVSDRYVMCLFPIVAIILASLISVIIRRHLAGVILAIAIVVIGLKFMAPNYLYLEQTKEQLDLEYEVDNYNCIMVGLTHGQGFSEVLKLSEFSQVIVAGEDEMQYMTIPTDNGEVGTVVYIYEGLDSEQYLKYIGDDLELESNPIELDSNIESFRAFVYE
jgi:hypothetical protein